MSSTQPQDHDEMPDEIDFSKGERGKFHRDGVQLRLSIHLDPDVQAVLAALANAKGVDLGTLVNDLLKKDIELMELGR